VTRRRTICTCPRCNRRRDFKAANWTAAILFILGAAMSLAVAVSPTPSDVPTLPPREDVVVESPQAPVVEATAAQPILVR
jgi:hypothetical protein